MAAIAAVALVAAAGGLVAVGLRREPPTMADGLDGAATPFGAVVAPSPVPEPWKLASVLVDRSGGPPCCFLYEFTAPGPTAGTRGLVRLCLAPRADQTCALGEPAASDPFGVADLFERRALRAGDGTPVFAVVYGRDRPAFDEWRALAVVRDTDQARASLDEAERRPAR